MAIHYVKPGFEVLAVGGECTAYSGAEASPGRPRSAAGPAVAPAPGSSATGGPVPGRVPAAPLVWVAD